MELTQNSANRPLSKDIYPLCFDSSYIITRWVNKFTSVKAMNESRFWSFFTYIFDLHNLMKQGNLRSVANPRSPLRWELLPNLDDFEPSLLQMSGNNILFDGFQFYLRNVFIASSGKDGNEENGLKLTWKEATLI